MKVRKATLATLVAGAVALGLAGCGFATPTATEQSYDASDGTNFTVGSIHVNNIAWVADENGEAARLIGQLSNNGDTAATVVLTLPLAAGQETVQGIALDPGQAVSLTDDANQVVVPNLGTKPGASTDITVRVGSEHADGFIRVTGGTLKEYASLVPTPSPSASATPAQSASPSPSAN